MKNILFSLTILGAMILMGNRSIAALNPSSVGFGVSIGFFYSSLSPHGEWIEVEA